MILICERICVNVSRCAHTLTHTHLFIFNSFKIPFFYPLGFVNGMSWKIGYWGWECHIMEWVNLRYFHDIRDAPSPPHTISPLYIISPTPLFFLTKGCWTFFFYIYISFFYEGCAAPCVWWWNVGGKENFFFFFLFYAFLS